MEQVANGQLSFEDELAEVKPYFLVNQSNSLINSQQDLTITERRIIYSLISLVQPEDSAMKTYVLPVKQLAKLIGIAESSFYERVERSIDELQKKMLIIEHKEKPDGPVTVVDKINWVQQATYIKRQGLVRVKLSDALASYLLNLKSSYTKYRIGNVLKLKSEYSWRLYELLKEREPLQNKRVFKIAELRKLLNLEDKHLETKNLRSAVLDRAAKELKEKTDIYFEYEVHKKIGRRIDSFIFYIHKNVNKNNIEEAEESINYDLTTLINRLLRYNVNQKTVSKWIDTYHPNYIEENLEYALRMKSGSVNNISAYIVKAVGDNYANSPFTYDKVNDLDNSFYSLSANDYLAKISFETTANIKALKETYDQFTNIITSKADTMSKEEIEILRKDREKQIIEQFERINESRRKKRFANLHSSDFQNEAALLPFIKKYEESQIDNDIPY